MRIQSAIATGLTFLILGGGARYARHEDESETAAHALAASPSLPTIQLSRPQVDSVDKLELTQPDAPAFEQRIVLERRAGSWSITAPITTAASASKVTELLENLERLRLTDAIDTGSTRYYERYGLIDGTAFHFVAWSGKTKLSDLYFGKSSARGQLLRIGGLDGVYGIDSAAPGSYSGFLFTRPLRGWRETSILHFDEHEVVAVRVNNAHGLLSFDKHGSSWAGSIRVRTATGVLEPQSAAWPSFDESKVLDLLRAYHSLSADEFGRDADLETAGLERAEQTGGVVSLVLASGEELTMRIGRVARGPSTWAVKDSRWAVKEGGDGTLYALASWNADWATADASRFEKASPRR